MKLTFSGSTAEEAARSILKRESASSLSLFQNSRVDLDDLRGDRPVTLHVFLLFFLAVSQL